MLGISKLTQYKTTTRVQVELQVEVKELVWCMNYENYDDNHSVELPLDCIEQTWVVVDSVIDCLRLGL